MIDLFKSRRNAWQQMAVKYTRLMANSGLLFTLYILILAGGVYYQSWAKALPDSFPTEWIMGVALSVFIVRSPIRTYLESADLVFLLPLEKQMSGYFRLSVRQSFLGQAFLVLILSGVFMPLYLYTVYHDTAYYCIVVLFLIGLKWWNLVMRWHEFYLMSPAVSLVIRMVLTFVFTLLLYFRVSYLYMAVFLVIMYLLHLYFSKSASRHLLRWEEVLKVEQDRRMAFLKIANLFTDVPSLQGSIRPRRFLDPLSGFIGYGKSQAFTFLYLKTYIRSGNYLGITLRLLVIGWIVSWLLTAAAGSIITLVFVLYLTAIQLLPLATDGQPLGTAGLYPITREVKNSNFLRLLFIILAADGILVATSAISAGGWILFGEMTVLALAFAIVFVYGYAAKRLAKLK